MNVTSRLAPTLLLVLCVAPAAWAGDELFLRWDNCYGDGGAYNKLFACDTNSGAEVLVGSFRLGSTTDSISGAAILMDLTSIGPQFPSWWGFGTGYCRTAASLQGVFVRPSTSTVCADPWLGQAYGGPSFRPSPYYENRARIQVVLAVPQGGEGFTAQAGQEVFAFQLRINHARTTGLGACGGCGDPICISWSWGGLYGPQEYGYAVSIMGSATPNNGSNVTWQTGAVASTQGTCHLPPASCATFVLCQSVTPARTPTWGTIKSLYR